MNAGFSKCRSVLVTGANRGIGLQIVTDILKSHERPGRIFATARNPAAAKELQDIAKKHSDVYILPLDVTNQASIDSALQEVMSLVGPEGLNCLINNAAINVSTNLETVTATTMVQTFESNTVGPLMVAKVSLNEIKVENDHRSLVESSRVWLRCRICRSPGHVV